MFLNGGDALSGLGDAEGEVAYFMLFLKDIKKKKNYFIIQIL